MFPSWILRLHVICGLRCQFSLLLVRFLGLNCLLSAALLLQIYFWGQSRPVNARRRRRAIPDNAPFVVASDGNTQTFVVTNLTPYSNYDLIVKAFNNGGEGPPSDEVSAATLEAGKKKNRIREG